MSSAESATAVRFVGPALVAGPRLPTGGSPTVCSRAASLFSPRRLPHRDPEDTRGDQIDGGDQQAQREKNFGGERGDEHGADGQHDDENRERAFLTGDFFG